MRQHLELFKRIQQHDVGFFYRNPTFEAAVNFINGFDLACEGGLLAGFREWLIVRLDDCVEKAWPSLVLFAAFPDCMNPSAEFAASAENQSQALKTLWELLFDFEADLQRRGLASIMSAFGEWWRANYGNDPMPRV